MTRSGKIRLLVFSYYFPPSSVAGARRPYSFLQSLDPAKFEIHVIIPSQMDAAYPDRTDQELNNTAIHVHKTWSPPVSWLRNKSNESSKPGRLKTFLADRIKKLIWPDKGFIWAYTAYLKAKSLQKKDPFDKVYSTSPLVSAHMAALKFCKKYPAITWICEFRDFFATHNSVQDFNPEKARKLERAIMAKASQLIFVTKTMETVYLQTYPLLKGKTRVIYNGTDQVETPIQGSSQKNIFYAGTFYNGLRNPLPLLVAVDQLIKKELIRSREWSIVIAGNKDQYLWNDPDLNEVRKIIEVKGPLTLEQIRTELSKAAACWLIVPDIDSHRDTIPAKCFEYLYWGKPIIAFIPNGCEADVLLKQFDGVLSIYPDMDESEITDKLFKFLSSMKPLYNRKPFPYLRHNLAEEFERVLRVFMN